MSIACQLLSRLFLRYGRFDIGLKLLSSSLLREILFSIGVKEASLNKVGIEASRNDKLTIFAMIGSMADIHCFRSQVGIGSRQAPTGSLNPPSNCDHNIVFGKLSISKPKTRCYVRTVQNFNNIDVNQLNNALIQAGWDNIFRDFTSDIDVIHEN